MMAATCLLLVLGGNVYNAAFDEAALAYESGQYGEAIDRYEQLIGESVVHAAVFYNLGNAYYRHGDVPAAIANYERALQIDPRLDPARRNLDQAVRETQQRLARPLPADWEQSLLFWHYNMAPRETFWAAMALWLAFWAVLGVRQWRPLRYTRGAGLVLGLLAAAFGASVWAKAHPAQLAVAGKEIVSVRYGTGDEETVRFELYAGDRVTVDRRVPGWARVTSVDGERGWARDDSLLFVGPPYAPFGRAGPPSLGGRPPADRGGLPAPTGAEAPPP